MKVDPVMNDKMPELSFSLRDSTEEQVSIVIVNHNQAPYLNMLLQSIVLCSMNHNYEIVIVDNGSGKEDQEFLDSLPDDVKVIRNDKNLYWSKAANQGFKATNKDSKYVIFMHPDVVILNNSWVDVLATLSEEKKSGIVGARTGEFEISKQPISYVQEHCVLYTRECFNDLGGFPEILPQMGHSFIQTIKAAYRNYNPIALDPKTVTICHHYSAFNIPIEEWNVILQNAYNEIPKLIQQIQSKPFGNS